MCAWVSNKHVSNMLVYYHFSGFLTKAICTKIFPYQNKTKPNKTQIPKTTKKSCNSNKCNNRYLFGNFARPSSYFGFGFGGLVPKRHSIARANRLGVLKQACRPRYDATCQPPLRWCQTFSAGDHEGTTNDFWQLYGVVLFSECGSTILFYLKSTQVTVEGFLVGRVKTASNAATS